MALGSLENADDEEILSICEPFIDSRDECFISVLTFLAKSMKEKCHRLFQKLFEKDDYSWVQRIAILNLIDSMDQFKMETFISDYNQKCIDFLIKCALSLQTELSSQSRSVISRFISLNNVEMFRDSILKCDFFNLQITKNIIMLLNVIVNSISPTPLRCFIGIVLELFDFTLSDIISNDSDDSAFEGINIYPPFVSDCFEFLSHYPGLFQYRKSIERICMCKMQEVYYSFTQEKLFFQSMLDNSSQASSVNNEVVSQASQMSHSNRKKAQAASQMLKNNVRPILSTITTDVVADASLVRYEFLKPLKNCLQYLVSFQMQSAAYRSVFLKLLPIFPKEILPSSVITNCRESNRISFLSPEEIEMIRPKILRIFNSNRDQFVIARCCEFFYQSNIINQQILIQVKNIVENTKIKSSSSAFEFFKLIYSVEPENAMNYLKRMLNISDNKDEEKSNEKIALADLTKNELALLASNIPFVYKLLSELEDFSFLQFKTNRFSVKSWFERNDYASWPLTDLDLIEEIKKMFDKSYSVRVKDCSLIDNQHWTFLMKNKTLFHRDTIKEYLNSNKYLLKSICIFNSPNDDRNYFNFSEEIQKDIEKNLDKFAKVLPTTALLFKKGKFVKNETLIKNFLRFSKIRISDDLLNKMKEEFPNLSNNFDEYTAKIAKKRMKKENLKTVNDRIVITKSDENKKEEQNQEPVQIQQIQTKDNSLTIEDKEKQADFMDIKKDETLENDEQGAKTNEENQVKNDNLNEKQKTNQEEQYDEDQIKSEEQNPNNNDDQPKPEENQTIKDEKLELEENQVKSEELKEENHEKKEEEQNQINQEEQKDENQLKQENQHLESNEQQKQDEQVKSNELKDENQIKQEDHQQPNQEEQKDENEIKQEEEQHSSQLNDNQSNQDGQKDENEVKQEEVQHSNQLNDNQSNQEEQKDDNEIKQEEQHSNQLNDNQSNQEEQKDENEVKQEEQQHSNQEELNLIQNEQKEENEIKQDEEQHQPNKEELNPIQEEQKDEIQVKQEELQHQTQPDQPQNNQEELQSHKPEEPAKTQPEEPTPPKNEVRQIPNHQHKKNRSQIQFTIASSISDFDSNFPMKSKFLKVLCNKPPKDAVVVTMYRMHLINRINEIRRPKQYFYFLRFLRISLSIYTNSRETLAIRKNTIENFGPIAMKLKELAIGRIRPPPPSSSNEDQEDSDFDFYEEEKDLSFVLLEFAKLSSKLFLINELHRIIKNVSVPAKTESIELLLVSNLVIHSSKFRNMVNNVFSLSNNLLSNYSIHQLKSSNLSRLPSFLSYIIMNIKVLPDEESSMFFQRHYQHLLDNDIVSDLAIEFLSFYLQFQQSGKQYEEFFDGNVIVQIALLLFDTKRSIFKKAGEKSLLQILFTLMKGQFKNQLLQFEQLIEKLPVCGYSLPFAIDLATSYFSTVAFNIFQIPITQNQHKILESIELKEKQSKKGKSKILTDEQKRQNMLNFQKDFGIKEIRIVQSIYQVCPSITNALKLSKTLILASSFFDSLALIFGKLAPFEDGSFLGIFCIATLFYFEFINDDDKRKRFIELVNNLESQNSTFKSRVKALKLIIDKKNDDSLNFEVAFTVACLETNDNHKIEEVINLFAE